MVYHFAASEGLTKQLGPLPHPSRSISYHKKNDYFFPALLTLCYDTYFLHPLRCLKLLLCSLPPPSSSVPGSSSASLALFPSPLLSRSRLLLQHPSQSALPVVSAQKWWQAGKLLVAASHMYPNISSCTFPREPTLPLSDSSFWGLSWISAKKVWPLSNRFQQYIFQL